MIFLKTCFCKDSSALLNLDPKYKKDIISTNVGKAAFLIEVLENKYINS